MGFWRPLGPTLLAGLGSCGFGANVVRMEGPACPAAEE